MTLKGILMEYLESVDEGRLKADAILSDMEATGELLDPEFEQGADEEELQEHPDYQIALPDEIDKSANKQEAIVSIPSMSSTIKMTCALIPENLMKNRCWS